LCPFPRDPGAAQKLAVAEASGEFQGHVIWRLLLLRITAAGQADVKAGGGREQVESVRPHTVRNKTPDVGVRELS